MLPVASHFKHVQLLQRGGDVLGTDAGQFGEFIDAQLSFPVVVQTLQHHALPISHVRQAAQIRQGLLWRPGLAFPFRQKVTLKGNRESREVNEEAERQALAIHVPMAWMVPSRFPPLSTSVTSIFGVDTAPSLPPY